MQEIRGTSMWKKVLEAEDIKKKIEDIVKQIQEHTTNFSVRMADETPPKFATDSDASLDDHSVGHRERYQIGP